MATVAVWEAAAVVARARLPRSVGFANASLALTTLMASVGAPAPLYVFYEQHFGVTAPAITGSYGTYILLAAASMLIGGRLSDHLGRRSVSITSLLLAAAACLMLVHVGGAAMLVASRGVQGIAAGLGMSTLGTYVIDLRAHGTTFLASLVASAAPTLGVAIGAILSGGLVQFGPRPTSLVYELFIALLLVSAAGVLWSQETRPPVPGALRSLRPALVIPQRMRAVFFVAVATFVASWSLGGFYQSLGPSIAVSALGSDSQLFSGFVVASMLGFTVIGGPLTSRVRAVRAKVFGLVSLAAGAGALMVAILSGTIWLFFVAGCVAGTGFGAACTGSMRTLLLGCSPAETAGVVSAVYLMSYTGAAVPSFVAGQLVPYLGLSLVATGYAVITIVLAVAAVVATLVTSRARGVLPNES